MSKRKNRDRSPNIPQETLDRARRQVEERGTVSVAGGDSGASEAPVVEAAPEIDAVATPLAATGKNRDERRADQGIKQRSGSGSARSRDGSARRASSGTGGNLAPRPRRRKSEELTMAEIEDLLEHPTKTVTEAQLRADYGYVLADLRNMGALAAALFIFLIILAQIL